MCRHRKLAYGIVETVAGLYGGPTMLVSLSMGLKKWIIPRHVAISSAHIGTLAMQPQFSTPITVRRHFSRCN